MLDGARARSHAPLTERIEPVWNEDIVVPIAFFVTTIVLAIGIPLVRGVVRRWDKRNALPATQPDTAARLERIEQAIDAMSIEVERIAEGQRFVTRLMADRSPERVALPLRGDERNS
jgi:hypothetical protein